MYINLFNKPSLVGLDLQPEGVRIIQLKRWRHTCLVLHAGFCPLPASIFSGETVVRWDILRDLLADYVDLHGLRGCAAAICVPAKSVRIQRLQVPMGLPQAGIETEIQLQVQRDLPGINDSLWIDYSIARTAQAGYWEVGFAAARSEFMSQYLHCVNAAGWRVKIIDVDLYAIWRALKSGDKSAEFSSKPNAMLHLTQHSVRLGVFNQHGLILQHEWDVSLHGVAGVLRNTIQQYLQLASQVPIQHLAVCGIAPYVNELAVHASLWDIELAFPEPLREMAYAPGVELNPAATADYILAYGLALREVPVW